MRAVRWCLFLCLCGLLPLRAGAQTLFPPTITPPVSPPDVALSAPPPVPDVPQAGGDQPFIGEPDADPANSLILDNADHLLSESADLNQYRLLGHIHIRYRGYTLTSDRADLDLDRQTALFTGNVILTTPAGQIVQGGPFGTLALNLRNSTYQVTGARATVPPQDLALGIILPVYVFGGTISGRSGFIDARGSQFTTCDFGDPHYTFAAKELYIVPGRHLVAKYVTYYRHGHRLFSIPYLYVPLDRRLERQTLTPQVGYDPQDGYFAKVALGYALSSTLPGLLRVDEYQKRGTGLGFDQAYGDLARPRHPSGDVEGYGLPDKSTGVQTITYGINNQVLVGTVQTSLAAQGQQNSNFVGVGHSQAQNAQFNLVRSVGAFNTSLQNNLTRNDYGTGVSQTLTSALENIFQNTRGTRLDTKFNYSGLTQPTFGVGASGSSQQRLDSNIDFTQQGRLVDLEILGNQYNQLTGGSTGTGYGGLERLPELRLATDATRLTALRSLLLPAATHLNLSLGDFNEPSSQTRTQRAFFGIDLGDTNKSQGRSSVDYGGVFQQAFYGDNTAQYTLNGRAGYRLRIGGKSSAGVSYTYLRPYGFTPFQFDNVGNTNNAALTFGYQETRQFQLTLATAYDITQTHSINGQSPTPWQNLAGQILFTPGSLLQLRTTSAYDINHGKLLDLTNNLRVRVHGGQALDLATRYDPVSHRFSQTNYSLDLPFLRDRNPDEDSGYRFQAIGGYNGITSQFTYKGFAVTRDWHDFEARLVYQDDRTSTLQSGQTITFNFQFRAFPSFQPFSISQFGQSLDPGLGPVY